MDRPAEALRAIGETARAVLAQAFTAREQALTLCREVVHHAALAIRATHRGQYPEARRLLEEARERLRKVEDLLRPHPSLYYAGFVEDAQKEVAEASLLLALLQGEPLPDFSSLGIGVLPYLQGLGEVAGELRRAVLEALRRGEVERATALLEAMDAIYTLLLTMDFPDGMTGGLRRTTDMVRGVVERTHGDVALAHRMYSLERRLALAEGKGEATPSPRSGE